MSACGGGSDDDGGGGGLFQFAAGPATAGFAPIVVSGGWFAYLADESANGPTGTDYNGNGSFIDTVPVVVEASTQAEFNLLVAATQIAWVGTHLYLVVEESVDGRNWLEPGMDDLVLLHWGVGQPTTAVAVLDPRGGRPILSTGGLLIFQDAVLPVGPFDSSLWVLGPDAPLAPIPVPTNDSVGPLRPVLVATDEGLVLASLDETVELRDLNGDGDSTDRNVVALLNGSLAPTGAQYSGPLRSTRRASLAAAPTPFRAKRDASGAADWIVGFLVSEAGELENFNTLAAGLPAGWLPSRCAVGGMSPDTDMLDDVLFYLNWAEWTAANSPTEIRNTGLVGKDRVAIVQDFVGTVSPESMLPTGIGEPCDLNDDGDRTDEIFRWVQAAPQPAPILPPGEVAVLFPAGEVPGGTFGIAELDTRWLLAVSEEQDGTDLNQDGFFDLNILGWFDPAISGGWTFDNGMQGSMATAAATWMGEVDGRQRVGVGFSELANEIDLTANGTVNDSVATFALFDEVAVRITYPGFGIAAEADNAGIVIQNETGFYRVSEAAQGGDLNGDGQANDFLLWRSQLETGATVMMFNLNDVERRAIEADDADALLGAFVVDENQAGDVNQDGRSDTFAVVYFSWQ